jgi:hypothetical protein
VSNLRCCGAGLEVARDRVVLVEPERQHDTAPVPMAPALIIDRQYGRSSSRRSHVKILVRNRSRMKIAAETISRTMFFQIEGPLDYNLLCPLFLNVSPTDS